MDFDITIIYGHRCKKQVEYMNLFLLPKLVIMYPAEGIGFYITLPIKSQAAVLQQFGGKMNVRHKQSTLDKQNSKSINIIIILCLAILAVMIGIQAGDVWYKLDVSVVENLDTENFKNALNLSLPIIEQVYNSGEYSVSFSGEIKDLLVKLFDFDLESPVSILNIQSPVFMSYYNKISNAARVAAPEHAGDEASADKAGSSGDTGKAGLQGDSQALPGQDGQKDCTGKDNTADGGNNSGNETGDSSGNSNAGSSGGNSNAGSSGGKNDSGGRNADGTGNNSQGGKSEGNRTGTAPDGSIAGNEPAGSGEAAKSGNTDTSKSGTTGNPKNPADLQPISSITYEVEDDEKEENSDLVAVDSIVLNNFTKHRIDIAKLLKEPLKLNFSKKGPKVLVYHTHTSESYVLKASDLGKKAVPSFTTNPKYSVVRVGEELARNLRKYGIETLHDGTVHDKVRDAAYGVAINTLQSYKKGYPSAKVYIDVHRDATVNSKLRLTKNINGRNAAQIMFVVGSDGKWSFPGWQENLKFVLKLQQELNKKYPGLARPIRIVDKRYNQQISDGAILIEVGGDGNLLSECLESTKYLAEALNKVMSDK